MSDIPQLELDLFSDDTLRHTPERYRALLEAAPIVYLPVNGLYAATRYEAVRSALRADDVLISGRGVGANASINDGAEAAKITLFSDGDTHRRRRAVLGAPLTPAAVGDIRATVASQADALVARLVEGGEFCVVKDFAAHLPLTIVAELVGLPAQARERMLDWAAATFNLLGVINDRTKESMPVFLDMQAFLASLQPDEVSPGSWAARIFEAAEEGRLSEQEAAAMVLDYVAPSLDTTILASAHMFWQLAVNPDAFAALRAEPDLATGLVNESVRLASPIRGFTRFVSEAFTFDGHEVPSGSRIAVLYAAANRDGRKFENPERFDILRNPKDHIGWGHGAHSCAGKHLARLEMEELARALARHAKRLEVGEGEVLMNNVLQGFAALAAVTH